MRTQGTPKDGCSEEGVVARAVKAVWCISGTNILDVDLEVENAGANESGNEAGRHLSPECVARRNLRVVCELEIVQELDGVSACDVAKRLEEIHGQSIASNPSASNELGQDVESDLNTTNGSDDTNREDEYQTERKTVEDDTDSGLVVEKLAIGLGYTAGCTYISRPRGNASTTESN